MTHPTRYVHLEDARRRHGADVDRCGAWLRVGDPLADAAAAALAPLPAAERTPLVDAALRGRLQGAPPALADLVVSMRTLPPWVDRARMGRGAAAVVRAGLPAGLVLGCSSLVLGFCSPAGNKPLVFTGRLEGAARRRLAETSRFVHALTTPGGALPGGEGWIAAAKVRLMHAAVRRALMASPRWTADDWGVPINAFDSAGTILLFSLLVADGLAGLGFPMTAEERGDLLHLWRYVGHVIGVPEPLLFADEASARAFWDLVVTTQDPPDGDARLLVHATLNGGLGPRETNIATRARARAVRGVAWATARRLLDPTLVADLDFPPPDGWDRLLRLLHPANRALTRLRSPRLDRHRYAAGVRYWEEVVREGLAGVPADFAMPGRG
ncbi:MAG: oxygenase MpaB family protein [Myxococcota bacterium]